eukprot:12849436-Prorocentrum_lima.AAC.2
MVRPEGHLHIKWSYCLEMINKIKTLAALKTEYQARAATVVASLQDVEDPGILRNLAWAIKKKRGNCNKHKIPKGTQGSPTEEIRKEALDIDRQTEDLIKSSHEQGTHLRKCAEELKSVIVTSKEVASSKGETLTE